MRRYVKATLTALVLVTVVGVAGYQGVRAEESAADNANYDLAALRILNRVILLVRENYVEPQRIKPRQMLLGALDYVQKSVAEVMVDHAKGSDEVTVRVNGERKTFSIRGLDNLWEMSFKLRDIFQFLQGRLSRDNKFRRVEYSAINGLLNTLDPHSVLLRPEIYREMDLGTKGHFGGLGIVISIRDGALTIISPLAGTPASRIDLRARDKIVQIEDESTINMSLTEAVNRLRGKPGTPVTIWVERKGWSEPKRYRIVRDDIKIRSVDSRALAPGVGYIRVKNFDANTSSDVRAHLRKLKSKGNFKGLVLDLRNNPGGLFKSAVEVSNLFIPSGTIVTTVGMGEKVREEQRARGEGESDFPIVTLVNSGSASASEIVSGALKNLNRGLVLGQQTFGKGSVQVLYNFRDQSALKLTVAQYLTPGDVSIQSVGITPDVLILPVVIDKKQIDFFGPEKPFREKDLKKHLKWSKHPPKKGKPLAKVKFLEARVDPKDRAFEDPDKFKLDIPIKLARDMIKAAAAAGATKRMEVFRATRKLLDKRHDEMLAKIVGALAKLGVDWSPRGGANPGAPNPSFEVRTEPSGKLKAGEKIKLSVTVKNNGTGDLYQLRAMTKSGNRLWTKQELVFGRVPAGKSKTWTLPIKIPQSTYSRYDLIKFTFFEGERKLPKPVEALVQIEGLPRPIFGYSMALKEVKGNGDGLIQRGETFDLTMRIKNVGVGKAVATLATLKNLSGQGVYIRKGRIPLKELAPNQTKTATLRFKVLAKLKKPQVKLEIGVFDSKLREFVSEKLKLPLDTKGGRRVTARSDGVQVSSANAFLRALPQKDAPVVGRVKKGASFPATGSVPGWYRVQTTDGVAWLSSARAAVLTEAPSTPTTALLSKEPPRLNVKFGEKDLLSNAKEIKLTGTVVDDERVQDMYIFVNNKKVFYSSNKNRGFGPTLPFEATVPLKKGKNRILLVARENSDLSTRAVLLVLRR